MTKTRDKHMPIVRVKHKFQVTIPTELREKLHLEEGDILEATSDGKTIILKPKEIFDREKLDAYLTEGLEELRAGKTVGPFESMEEYEEHIKRTS